MQLTLLNIDINSSSCKEKKKAYHKFKRTIAVQRRKTEKRQLCVKKCRLKLIAVSEQTQYLVASLTDQTNSHSWSGVGGVAREHSIMSLKLITSLV